MEIVNFLEQLGGMVHYDIRIPALIGHQSAAVREALITNNRKLLNDQISQHSLNTDITQVAAA